MPCNKCGECCRVLQLRFRNMGASRLDVFHQKEFYKTRGCEFKETKDEMIVSIPFVCPHLTENNLCGIHDTKPTICRKWGEDIRPMLKGCGYV